MPIPEPYVAMRAPAPSTPTAQGAARPRPCGCTDRIAALDALDARRQALLAQAEGRPEHPFLVLARRYRDLASRASTPETRDLVERFARELEGAALALYAARTANGLRPQV